MKDNVTLFAFNRGLVSKLALARQDIKRVALSARIQKNYMPRALGSMMFRPGLGYITNSRLNKTARYIPFIFSTNDLALVELTDAEMRVLVDDEVITRPAVTTAVVNGDFDTDLNGWTDADGAGATSSWATGGYMSLVGTGTNAAIRRQEVTVSGGNVGVVHALRIIIERGDVLLRIGSSSGGDEYVNETTLKPGTHSIAFTPAGNFFIQFANRAIPASLVTSCNVESPGDLVLPTPWLEADLSSVRWDQSGDVIFVGCTGYQQRRIERRNNNSWSIVKYEPIDGPFLSINTTPITLTASAITGDITLTASAALFRPTHVGALFKINSSGQQVEADLSGDNQFTDPIRVTGIGSARSFGVFISGTWSATVHLQRSVAEPGDWTDVTSYTTNQSTNYSDGLDNQIIYYRLGIKSGNYTSGTAKARLNFSAGSISGVARITGYTSSTQVSAAVVKTLGNTTATDNWQEGKWSDRRGWPSSPSLVEGRLFWVGKNSVDGSVSDSYESFDEDVEGDSGPISRTIGSGPVDSILWTLPLLRLLLGTAGSEITARSNNLDEPLTPSNFSLKTSSTQGSANVAAIRVDSKGIMVQRCGKRVYELAYDGNGGDYVPTDLTALVPEVGDPGIVRSAVQRQPDTRIHFVKSDGTVAVLLYDKIENLICWVTVETDGEIEDVVVLPGIDEDQVYYSVKREINGNEVRYLEKWAKESECIGGTLNKTMDSFLVWSGNSSIIDGLDHLEGCEVVAWADGVAYPGPYTVSGGQIDLGTTVSSAIVGLAYTGRFQGVKVGSLCERKKLQSLGLAIVDTHPLGLKVGTDFDHLYPIPRMIQGKPTANNEIFDELDASAFPLDGQWKNDSRLCMESRSPYCATIIAGVLEVEQNARVQRNG